MERFIEVGPAPVLKNMAERTMENLFDGLNPLIKQREFLSVTKDSDRVYYRMAPSLDELPAVSPIQPVVTETALKTTTIPTSTSQLSMSTIADLPLTAAHVLRTLIAAKVKKPVSEIDSGTTIKKLAGGRSTMENEIVGDLLVEFKSLPDRPEEQTIGSLCDMVEASFGGQWGLYVTSQLARLFSTRMPGGFKIETVRDYIKSTWGLLEGRQNMILLLAITRPPSSRLKTFESAEAFFDDLVGIHTKETGILVQKGQATPSTAQTSSLPDPALIMEFEEARKSRSAKYMQLHAQDRGIDLLAGEKKASVVQTALNEALEELDLWTTEHGSTYVGGIKPILQTSKARRYESWSHWALQDVTILFHAMMNRELDQDEQTIARRVLHILNCTDKKLVGHLKIFANRAKQVTGDTGQAAFAILESLSTMCERAISTSPVFRSTFQNLMPVTEINIKGDISVKEIPRVSMHDLQGLILTIEKGITLPALHQPVNLEYPSFAIKTRGPAGWQHNEHVSLAYLRTIGQLNNQGISFEGKTALLIGAGSGSIGAEILKGLLAGGANVICATSSFSSDTTRYFQEIYAANSGRGSGLVVIPFNQASRQDIESITAYIYGEDGLGWDLDLVIPFAAISEAGCDIDQIDAKSELAHRAMLTNTIRLLGAIKRQKCTRGFYTRPAQVILPLSSNHGIIGRDGLYAESKLGLESLLYKWHSEDWSDYLSLCGAEIGWTRGTGLMSSNDVVAQEVEALGVRTFSCQEMAANLLALCAPSVIRFCQDEPILADLNGGLDKIKDLGTTLTSIRNQMQTTKANLSAVHEEQNQDANLVSGGNINKKDDTARYTISRGAVPMAELSTLPDMDYDTQIKPLVSELKGMVDLDRVAVIAGFAELGPFGSARTRMEMELGNGFTDAGCIELAWTMGLIKRPAGNKDYGCWVDSETGEPVPETTIKSKYQDKILSNTGIRLVKSDDHEQQVLQEIIVETDLQPFTTTVQIAMDYVKVHGKYVETWQGTNPNEWHVLLKAGATMMVPKAISNPATVVGQLPTGWDPKRYGIEESIITQVDTVTLYTLITTVEALLVAGIPDFYALYKHVHTSEVANCIGSGLGGLTSLKSLFRDRYLDNQTVQKDVLQETFINTTGAWINMLLLGASGPIRTPVGACATSLESLDSAAELIHSGKTKIAIVGGVDDWSHEVGAEFQNMRATADYTAQQTCGRPASEFSRPMTSTRAGFVEAQGAGVQIVTSARLALDLGLPIHGIIAFTGLASDKPGRSVPAPGKGLLNFAATTAGTTLQHPNPMLNITYRRRLLERRLTQIEQNRLAQLEDVELEACLLPASEIPAYTSARHAEISYEAATASASTRRDLGNEFYTTNPHIAPLAGALSVWNLTADSISVLCMHGTSTSKGDTNEAQVLNTQLSHLRNSNFSTSPPPPSSSSSSSSSPALAVCSKWLTGHAKGAAGAWSLNTALQILATGIVPRNGNLDDLSPELVCLEHVSFLGGRGTGVKVAGGVDCVSVSSFGFGQKGAQALIVHPRFLFAVIEKDDWVGYMGRMKARRRIARRELCDGIWKGDLVGKRIKKEGAWGRDVGDEVVLLDKAWRMG